MFSIDNTPNLTGKTAVVTGANSGLGKETARAFAQKGAHVIVAARDVAKGNQAVSEIKKDLPNASLEVMELDLASLDSISKFVYSFSKNHQKLDFLINNAGLMAMPEGKTKDGFETQFGVNHLGHWALTGRLLPYLKKGSQSRIVTVTSSAHHMTPTINFRDPHLRKKYSAWRAYAQSKLANYYFALGLHRKFKAEKLCQSSSISGPRWRFARRCCCTNTCTSSSRRFSRATCWP